VKIAGVPDLLVRLYDLPATPAAAPALTAVLRRAFAAEKALVSAWVSEHFTRSWASEAEVSFARLPVSCWLAVEEERIVGFACYDATTRGFFGPFGIAEAARSRGLGGALLHATLSDMRAQGYAYAIVGAAAEIEFYRREAGAIEIPASDPGFYRGLLKQ